MTDSRDIEALTSLRNFLIGYRGYHVPTMNHYASSDGCGFWHQQIKRTEASVSSTATCVSSLVHASLWTNGERSSGPSGAENEKRRWGSSSAVAERLLRKPWTSAELKENNPFSLSFIAQGVLDLMEAEPYDGADGHKVLIGEIADILLDQVKTGEGKLALPGSVSIDPYPPSAYLTQLVFRVLVRTSSDHAEFADIAQMVKTWAVSEVYRQLALISTNNRLGDPLQLAYAAILLASASIDEKNSPEEKALIRQALKRFFGSQLPDGTWPPSQPLFHYPTVGNAHAFDYELLTELLRCVPLQDDLLDFIPQLKAAAEHLEYTAFELGGDAYGWASGHHPQIEGPESWSTASVYDFLHAFDRLVAEALRRALFDELGTVYSPPKAPDALSERKFAPRFLDADVRLDNGQVLSLKETLFERFVRPIDREKFAVAAGRSLSEETPMSAILYGPPGTSKTQLAKLIGKYLGWPTVVADPSYVVQEGLDYLYARANKLFSMLSAVEQVVVLLDEFDELGRDRAQETEVLSRFITTAMLPKLAAINDERKIVFLLATNYLSRFDAAFRRGGRFDMILQVMPPTATAKLGNSQWAVIRSTIDTLSNLKRARATAWLEDLTYIETNELASLLKRPTADPYKVIKSVHERSTLMRRNVGNKNWKQTSADERDQIRLPVPTD